MPATVATGPNFTNISLVNNNTGFSVWKRDGTGGTPSAISETDVFVQGTGACSVKVSNQGVVLAYGTGGINLSAANTHIYIWVNMLAGGLMAARASNGLCIFLSSDAALATGSAYKMWAVDGSDTYPGGWVRYVLDVSKTATVSGAGSLSLSNVTWVGMYCDTRPNVAKFDNLVIDRIDYTTGDGLRVYGTSTTDDLFGDIWTADAGTVGAQYGIIRRVQGVYYLKGRIALGDNVGSNASDLTDIDKIVVYENPVYYNGSSVVSSISTTLYRMDVVGNGTGSTTVQFGKKVGTGDTARGRNGLTITSAGPNVVADFDDGSADTVKIYGSTFRLLSGPLTWGTTASGHEFIGNTVDQCGQFDPVGGTVSIRNCVFSGTTDSSSDGSALLWNSSIDIKNCSFVANSDVTNDPHGIEHGSTGEFNYFGLIFSGNDYDIENSSAGLVTINNLNDSNTSTYENTGGGSTTIVSNVNITVTVKNQAGDDLAGVEVAIFQDNTARTILLASTPTDELGQITTTAATSLGDIIIRARQSSNIYGFHTTTGVNTGTETITTTANHTFQNGDRLVYTKNGGSYVVSASLTEGSVHYAGNTTANTLQLYDSAENAILGGATGRRDLTGGAGSETHSLDPVRYVAASGTATVAADDVAVQITMVTDAIATG